MPMKKRKNRRSNRCERSNPNFLKKSSCSLKTSFLLTTKIVHSPDGFFLGQDFFLLNDRFFDGNFLLGGDLFLS